MPKAKCLDVQKRTKHKNETNFLRLRDIFVNILLRCTIFPENAPLFL